MQKGKAQAFENLEPDASETVAEMETHLKGVIASWAAAWQSQLLDVYFLHYYPGYFPADFMTAEAWKEDRREKMIKPEYIHLSLDDFELTSFSEEQAVIRFTMGYQRPGYEDETNKEITLRSLNGLWLIDKELSLRVIKR